MDCSRLALRCLLTLCERWRGEDESSHWVGGRGRHWWGQDTAVWGGWPVQGAAGPAICTRRKARMNTSVSLRVSACCFLWPRQTLFWRQGRSLWQGAGGGSVEDPFSILIIGRNICWWHKQNKRWSASLNTRNKVLTKTTNESWEYLCAACFPHWYFLRKAPPGGKAAEFLPSSLPERRWPREG